LNSYNKHVDQDLSYQKECNELLERETSPPHYDKELNLYSVSLIVKSVIEADTMEEAEKMLRRDMHAGDIDDWCVMATDTKRIYE